jgi:hypothetical protein
MSIRLVITITVIPGAGSELAQVLRQRCAEVLHEPGREQYELFQSVENPDTLDEHARLMSTLPPIRPDLRLGNSEREDFAYNRTR